MQRLVRVFLAATLMLAPVGAQAADLVVWWEEGWYPDENRAVAELVAAFEQKTGKQVELLQPTQDELSDNIEAALAARQPPDFAYGILLQNYDDQWAYEDRLVELRDAVGHFSDLFDPDLLQLATMLNGRTGGHELYALPMGRDTNHVHVWQSLLERAGFTLADIPKEWEAFWSFWCEQVQPAVRKVTGRDDIYGVGLPMSIDAEDTEMEIGQFAWAYTPRWPSPAGWNLVEEPATRAILIRALERYTAIYKNGCTPPDAVDWTGSGNNRAFLEQRVVMTPNPTLSIPNQLRAERPEDYDRNTATIEWPRNAFGDPLANSGGAAVAVAFREGGNPALAKEFVRFLVEDGWLAHWLDFSRDRMLPPMQKLIDQPFWLDPGDPHRMRSAIQTMTQPQSLSTWGVSRDQQRRFDLAEPQIMGTAVHRVAAEGWSAERGADEAIARIKQILSE
jgi:multiple sugar transport system substrate-binding protein